MIHVQRLISLNCDIFSNSRGKVPLILLLSKKKKITMNESFIDDKIVLIKEGNVFGTYVAIKPLTALKIPRKKELNLLFRYDLFHIKFSKLW